MKTLATPQSAWQIATPVGCHAVPPAVICAWRDSLGEENVLTGTEATESYCRSTTGVGRRISAVLTPQDVGQVQSLARIANEHRIPLYPISTGRNWGYGSANPVLDGCALVDLSNMNRVVEFDAELGVVTVEPGVTQQVLRDYLDHRDAPFYVPTHGGGPDCSLLGNALERGYGITPHADHFGALTALEAVLPDGRLYRGAFEELACREINQTFKWGIGPYLDGLFAQGNMGIVTQGTIALAPVAANVQAFSFSLRGELALEGAVLAVREVLRSLPGLCGSINLMNSLRMLSMMVPYPQDVVTRGGAIPEEAIESLAREKGIAPWTGIGALYGDPSLLRAARKIIRRHLRPCAKNLIFFDHARLRNLDRVLRFVPLPAAQRLRGKLQTGHELLDIVSGKPRRTALPLAYWKSGRTVSTADQLDPAQDCCGLIWYSPLVPMKAERVRQYVETVATTCRQHGMDPLITLTSLSDRVFDSTVPILFRRENAREVEQAHACYDDLFDRGAEHGCVPYRVGIQHMEKVIRRQATCWQLVEQIKSAIDPHQIIAPGRYAPTKREATP